MVRFLELNVAERVGLLEWVAWAQENLAAIAPAPEGFNPGVNDGPAAGQTMAQFHLHIIPGRGGDVADPRGGVRRVIPEKAIYW